MLNLRVLIITRSVQKVEKECMNYLIKLLET